MPELGSDDSPRRALTHQCLDRRAAERTVSPEIGICLEHAGLPSPVRPGDDRGPLGCGRQHGATEEAEVDQFESSQRHRGPTAGPQDTRTGIKRYRKGSSGGAVHGRCARRIRGLDDHLVTGDRLHAVDEVRGVERDHQILSGVVAVDRLRRIADVLALHAQIHPA